MTPEALLALFWAIKIKALVASLRAARFQTTNPGLVTYYWSVEELRRDTVKVIGGVDDGRN
jgi:hypothetical protein